MEPTRLPGPRESGDRLKKFVNVKRLPDPPQVASEKGCYVTFEGLAGGRRGPAPSKAAAPPSFMMTTLLHDDARLA